MCIRDRGYTVWAVGRQALPHGAGWDANCRELAIRTRRVYAMWPSNTTPRKLSYRHTSNNVKIEVHEVTHCSTARNYKPKCSCTGDWAITHPTRRMKSYHLQGMWMELGSCADWNKSQEKQIPYDFTHTWNLRNKTDNHRGRGEKEGIKP